MKILRSWLTEYVKTDKSNEEIADLLTFSGSLVDEVLGKIDKKVVAVKILEVKKHPNADKLQLARVTDGKEEFNIVCGAPNIAVDQIVPLAKIGTKFSDFEIKEALIRGEKSFGMLCSEKELGISENHEGIMQLPANTPLGKSVVDLLDSDAIFDLEITPNRGDCLSHVGMARELSAVLDKKLDLDIPKIDDKDSDFLIEILSPEKCPRYCGITISDIKIGPSPDWLVKKIEAMDGKSINNLVDITNYIMFDLGQPLHAFDAKKISDNNIVVREAKKDEEFITLDNEKRILSEEMLVIADPEKAVALAGVMGGLNSEVDDNTTSIILESAEFNPVNIRQTAKKLGLATEASYRFERGIDPEMTEKALDKATSLIVELCGGKITGKKTNIASTYENTWVPFELERINNLLGTDIKEADAKKYLENLGFVLKDNMVQAPSWRHDVTIWQDLAEEIGRIFDLNNIAKVETPKTEKPKSGIYHFKEHMKDVLVEAGFSEVNTYSFLSEADLEALKLDKTDLLEVANPVQPENKYLRKFLLPSLLKAVAKNPIFDPVLIFEIGNVFTTSSEEAHLALASSGKNAKKEIESAISNLKDKLKLDLDIQVNELSRDDLLKFKIKKPVTYTFEIKIDDINKNSKINKDNIELTLSDKQIHYRAVSKYPSITRDVAFIVDASVEADKITNLIYEESELINRVELFDEFASDKFGEDKKNVAYHIYLQAESKTLTDKEAEEIVEKIISSIEKAFEAKIRDY
jgi:phenylalanyl-tRNA synthetase beta chain